MTFRGYEVKHPSPFAFLSVASVSLSLAFMISSLSMARAEGIVGQPYPSAGRSIPWSSLSQTDWLALYSVFSPDTRIDVSGLEVADPNPVRRQRNIQAISDEIDNKRVEFSASMPVIKTPWVNIQSPRLFDDGRGFSVTVPHNLELKREKLSSLQFVLVYPAPLTPKSIGINEYSQAGVMFGGVDSTPMWARNDEHANFAKGLSVREISIPEPSLENLEAFFDVAADPFALYMDVECTPVGVGRGHGGAEAIYCLAVRLNFYSAVEQSAANQRQFNLYFGLEWLSGPGDPELLVAWGSPY